MPQAGPAPQTPGARRGRWVAAGFPLALWFFATFFLLGDLGKWNDDWFYLQREPETGEIQSLYLNRPVHFWRPLYRAAVPALQTLLWKHDPLNHLISAAAHGLNCILLWSVLRALGVRRLPAAMAGLLFLVTPAPYEAVFWLCALPTSLSTTLVLGSFMLCIAYARRSVGGWARLLFPLVALAAASLNEQPACAMGALPLVYWFAKPAGERGAAAVARALAPAIAAGAALVAYAALHRQFVTAQTALHHDTFMVPLAELAAQIPRLAGWARMQFLSGDFAATAMQRGVDALRSDPARAAGAGVMLGLTVLAWVRFQGAAGADRARLPAGSRPAGAMALTALGGAILFCGWAPIAAFNYWLNSRIAYIPTVGLAILLAAGATALSERTPQQAVSAVRYIAAAIGALVTLPLALMMLGIQHAYSSRARQDLREVAALRSLVPKPPPGAVFAPVRIARPTDDRRAWRFENVFWSAFASAWSAPSLLRFEYRRSDLDCGHAYWGECSLRQSRRDGAMVEEVGFSEWSRIVPFEIDRTGNILLVTRMDVHPAAGEPFAVDVPLTSSLPVPPRTFVLRER
jgi:hypothetical protein